MTTIQRCRYAVLKYAHDPVRHEPVNVGVVIWQIEEPFVARWRFDGTMKRIEKLYPSANLRAVKHALAAFRQMIENQPDLLISGVGGVGSIFITEPRAVRCVDMDVELGDLFDVMVRPAEADADEPREKHRSARFIRARMNEIFKGLGVLNALLTDDCAKQLRIIECKSGVKHTFDFAYQNGTVHRIDALSFDHGSNPDRIARARSFANLAADVANAPDAKDAVIEAVIQVPTESLESDVYDQALKILHTVPITITEVRSDADLQTYCERTRLQVHS
jgi:Protein of unknown function (DUF3037)